MIGGMSLPGNSGRSRQAVSIKRPNQLPEGGERSQATVEVSFIPQVSDNGPLTAEDAKDAERRRGGMGAVAPR